MGEQLPESEVLRRALQAAAAKRTPDHTARLKRGLSAEELKARLPPLWEGEYCPGCELPLKSKPCPTCQDRKAKDAALLAEWKEKMGGEKAWVEYTKERFVKTAFNNAGYVAACMFQPSQNLLLHGPKGTGKSHLSTIAVRPAVVSGKDVKTVFMQDELGIARAQMKIKDEVRSRIAAMVKATVLRIEDLGVEKPSEWVVNEWYYPIFDGRYRARKNGLVVTMNFSLEELANHWARFDPHERVVSRMREMFRGAIFSLAGERDWRAQ